MRKIAVVIGSRANWGRLKAVCQAIDNHPDLELTLIKAASAYDLPIEADYSLQCLIDGDNTEAMALTTGVFLTQIGGVLSSLNPDMVLIHGDRYEMLAVAIAASYMNIPLAHSEGGEKTGTIDDKVRYAISHLTDIHFPVTELSASRLRAIGKQNIHVVGSTALDLLTNIDLTNNRKEPYIVILHHPNTTDPEDITPLIEAVKQIPMHKVWVNPNVDAGNKHMLKMIHKQEVEFVKNLPPEEFARLINNCECLVGNTSAGIKEGAYLGVPYVCVGNRQDGREITSSVTRAPNSTDEIFQAILEQSGKRYKPDFLFGRGNAGKKIADILAEVKI